MKKIAFKILLCLGLIIMMHPDVFAANPPIDPSFRPANIPFNLDYSQDASFNAITVLNIIAGALLYIASPAAILVIVYSGFQMIIAQGETEKIGEAKKTLTWSIIALLVMIFSYTIIRIVIDITLKAGEAAA